MPDMYRNIHFDFFSNSNADRKFTTEDSVFDCD